jgi:hypothetical protein
MAERRQLEGPQLVRQGDGPKSPRSLAAEIEKQREKVQPLEQTVVRRQRHKVTGIQGIFHNILMKTTNMPCRS